jgi:YcxB-like protein
MKIETEITLEDLLAFNQYHNENSQFIKRRLDFLKYLMYGFALFAIGNALLKILQGRIHSAIIEILFASLFLAISWSKSRRYISNIYAKGMYKEGKNRGMIGRHEIIIHDDEIVEENDSVSLAIKWKAVEKIIKTEKYIFVYISSVSAFLIPRRSFMDNIAYDEFYNLIVSKKDIAFQN